MIYLVQRWRFAIICWLALAGGLTLTTVPASAAAESRTFDIAAGEAINTLPEFGRQAKLQTLFDYQRVRNLQTQAVNGDFEPEDALTRMLVGTGLTFERINRRTVAIRSAADLGTDAPSDRAHADKSVPTSTTVNPGANGNARFAQAEPRASQDSTEKERGAGGKEGPPVELGEVLVTGTHIRGRAPVGANLLTIT